MTTVNPTGSLASLGSGSAAPGSVYTLGPVATGTTVVPPGAEATVLAVVANGAAAEVRFGPPADTVATVPEGLLGIA
jgi:hypothetical protein